MISRCGDDSDDGDEFDGEQEPGGLGGPVFFDRAELSTDATDWIPGPDYDRAQCEAERGAAAVWRVVRGISPLGTWARTHAWQTREAEPVVRTDFHPGVWLALEARIRDLEARAADGDRYRALMARGGQQEGETGKDGGRSWRSRAPRSLTVAAVTWGASLAH